MNKNPLSTLSARLFATLFAASLVTTTSFSNEPEKNTKLFEPFAPKPSHPIPSGWELQILKGSRVENKTVLKNNKEIKVTVPAYELVPIAANARDSKANIIKDPGFKPNLANNQTDTIGAVLTEYSESTTILEEKLQNIIDTLEKEIGKSKEQIAKNDPKKPNNPSR
jgi:hypothetical protein